MAVRPIPHSMTATPFTIEGFRTARKLGANAVIRIQYDATEVMQGVTEVFLLRNRDRRRSLTGGMT